MATILVVEDEPDVRRMVQLVLERAGHTVRLAGDGEAALADIAAHRPDVVLLDVSMPVLSGFEVLDRLKADPATASLPVVMLTARSDYDSVARAWKGGVDNYVTKPFDPGELAQVIAEVLTYHGKLRDDEVADDPR